MALAFSLILAGVAVADSINADADADSVATPHPANLNATQDPGTTVAYVFSAHIRKHNQESRNVFVEEGDTAVVGITRGGDWLATDSGTPASFTWVAGEDPGDAYQVNKTGTLRVTVPCGTAEDVNRVMTVNLEASSIAKGQLDASRQITFTVTSSGVDDPGCAPSYVATGFYEPVGMDDLMVAKAGRAIPLKWNLYAGLVAIGNEIIDPVLNGDSYSLTSVKVSCPNLNGIDDTPVADDAGKSGLRYDYFDEPTATAYGQNVFVWNTPKSWAGSCRDFKLYYDGQLVKTATFRFEK